MVLGTRTVRAELAAREPAAGPPLPVPETPKGPDPADTAAESAHQPADRTTVSQGV
jgi:hypothetical protein